MHSGPAPKSNRSAPKNPEDTNQNFITIKILAFAMPVFALALAVPLAAYSTMGSFMRLSGDDYCYAAVLTRYGFWKAQWSSFMTNEAAYNGNRYSLTLFSDIAGVFGPWANRVLPGFVLVIWIAGLTWAFRSWSRWAGFSARFWEALVVAEFLSFFTLYQAPDLPQILYWRSGMLPYLAPIVVNAFLVGIVFWQACMEKPKIRFLSLTFLLAVISGGFSEAGAAFQGTLWASILVIVFLVHRAALRRQKKGQLPLLFAVLIVIIGSLAAMLLMQLSPYTRLRMTVVRPPMDFISTLTVAATSAKTFLVSTLIYLRTATAVTFLFSLFFSVVFFSRQPGWQGVPFFKWLGSLFAGLVICFLVVAAVCIPSAYIQHTYPEARTLVEARFAIVALVAALGFTIGMQAPLLIQEIRLQPWLPPAAGIVILGLLCLYPLRAPVNIFKNYSFYQKWAYYWDERHQEILAARSQGLSQVRVMVLDHPISNVGDIAPGSWYNECAKQYYGINIQADLPGWDK